jgi:hypothetical protein
VDGDFQPRDVYADFLQPRMRDGDAGALVATVAGQSVRSQLFEGAGGGGDGDGCLHACLSDLLQDKGDVYVSATFAAGDALVSLLPEQPAAPTWVLATSVGASRSPELLRLTTVEDLTAALEVALAAAVAKQLPQGSSPCIVYTLLHCQQVQQSVTPYTFVDIGWPPEDAPPLAESLDLLSCVGALCLKKPPPAYSEEHAVIQFLREAGVEGVPLCLVAIGETSEPEKLADMALLLEGIAPKPAGVPSQGLFGSKPVASRASPPRSPFQATNGNASVKLSVPNAEYMNYLEQRAMSPPAASTRMPPVSPGLFGSWNESPKQKSQAAEQLSQMNVSAKTDSVAALAESHGGNLLKRITQELGKCNEELRSKESAHVELARTKATSDEVIRENVALRKRVHHLVVTQQRREMERWCFHAFHVNVEKARAARKGVQAYKQVLAARWVIRRHAVHSFTAWKALMHRSRKLRNFLMRLRNVAAASAFAAWDELVASNKEKRGRLRQVVQRMRKSSISRAFGAWAMESDQNKATRQILMKAGRRMQNRQMDIAFATWFEHMQWIQHARAVVGKVSARMLNRSTASAFATWHESTEWIKSARSLVLKVANRITHGLAFPAFKTWAEWTTKIRRQTNVVKLAINRMRKRVTASAFTGWYHAMQNRVKERVIVTRVMTRILNGLMAGAFYAWANNTQEVVHVKNLMHRVSNRIVNQAIFHTFGQWKSNVVDLLEQREMVQRVTSRMLNQTVGGAFARWKDYAVENSRNNSLLGKMVRKFSRAKVAAAFEGWIDAHAAHMVMNQKAMKSLGKLKNQVVFGAFTTWVETWNENSTSRRLLARCVQRMQRKKMWGTFLEWYDTTAELKCRRVALDRAVRKLLMGMLATAFLGWSTRHRETKRQRDVCAKCIRRIAMASLAGALDAWRGYTVSLANQRQAAEKGIIRMKNRLTAAAWAGWMDGVAFSKGKRELLSKAVKRIQLVAVGSAFHGWLDCHNEKKERAILLTRVLVKLQLVAAAQALSTWIDHTNEMKRMKNAAAQCIRKIQNLQLSAAHHKWSSWAKEVSAHRQLVARTLARMLNRAMQAAFVTWLQIIRNDIKQRAGLERILLRMKNQQIQGAFDGWADRYKTVKLQKVALERCLAKMAQAVATSALNGWVDNVQTGIRMRRMAAKAANMLLNRMLLKPLIRWSEATAESKRMKHLANQAMKKFINRMLWGPFSEWRLSAQNQKRLLHAAAQCVKRMRAAYLHQVLTYWSVTVLEKQRMKAAATKILKRMKHNALHKVFAGWLDTVEQVFAHRRLLERMIVRMDNRLVAGCLLTWMSTVKSLVTHRTGIERTLARMNSRFILSAFVAWQHHTKEKVRMRSVLRKCVGKLSHQCLSGAFEVWAETVAGIVGTKRTVFMAWYGRMQDKKVSAAVMHKVVTRLHQMCVVGAFDAWSQWAMDLKTNRHTLNICLKRMVQQALSSAFGSWSVFATEQVHMRVVVRKCLSRILKKALFSSFHAWSMRCVDQKRMRVVLSRVVVRMQRLALRIAIDAWRTMHRQRVVIKNRAVARTFNNLLYYFQGWGDMIREIEAGFQSQIDRYCAAISHPRALRKCVRYWQAEAGRSQQVKQSAIALGFAGSLRAAFHRWSSGFRQRKHELWLLKRAAQRLVNQKAIIIMDKWADYTAERKELRHKADLALRAILMQEVRSAFRTWADFWREAIATRNALVTQQCRRLLHQAEMKVFRRWGELCETKRRLRNKMELLVGRSTETLKGNAFCKWIDAVTAQKFLLQRMEKAHNYFQRETMKHIRLTFYTWTFSCMGSRALRFASGRKFDRRVATIRIRQALSEWKVLHAENVQDRRNEKLMQRSVRKLFHRQVILTFEHWVGFYEMRKDLRAQLAVKIGRQVQGKAASAVERWVMLTKHEKEVRLLLARRMARLHGRISRWAWRALQTAVADQKRLEKVKRSCAIRFTKMAMKLGFDAWVTTHKREMTVRRRAVAKTLSNMLYYYEKWATVCMRLHKERELMLERYELKFRTPTMRKALFTWAETVRHVKGVIENAIGLGFAGSLRGGFMTWKSGFNQRKHELWLLRRAGQRLKNQKAIIILDRWCDYTAERKELRLKANAALIGLKMQHVRAAYRSWADFWRESVATRNALAVQQCRVFLHQTEAKAFGRWRDLCEDKRQLRYKLEVLIGRCANTLVADMFFTWSDTVTSAKFVKQRMAKAHQYYAREVIKQIRENFRHWMMMTWGAKALIQVSGRKFYRRIGFVKQRNALDAWVEVHAQEAEERRKEVLMQRSARKIFHRRVIMVFDCWMDFYAWRKQLREQLRERIGRQVQGKVAAAFQRWSMLTLHEKEVRILLQRRQARLSGRIQRWAFMVWVGTAAEQKRLVHVQTQAMLRLTKMAMKLGFDKWATTHKREMIVRRRAVAKTLSNVMYYFENWSSVCETLHNEREAMLERYFIKFKPQIMRNVISVWFEEVAITKDIKESTIALGFSSSLRGAYMIWKSGFYQRKHELWLLQRAGARLKNQKAIIILDRWCDYTAERKELREQANAALIGLKMRGVRAAFRTWADFWRESVTARAATVTLHCRRLLHQLEAKAFIRWSDLCATKRALRYKLELMVGRSHKTLVQDMFDNWATARGETTLLRGRLLKAQTHFAREMLRFCKGCFVEWATLATGKMELRRGALRKSVNRWGGKILGYHFDHWAGLCARHRQINRALTNVRMRVAGDLLGLVRLIFSEWRKMSDTSSRLRGMQVATVRRRLAKLLYGSCFKRWAIHSLDKVQALSAYIGSNNGTLVRKSFRQWIDHLEEKRKHFDSVRHHVAQLVERQYRWVWNMWVCEHQSTYRRYHTLICAVASVNRMHRLRCFLRHWRGDVVRSASAGLGLRKKPAAALLAECFVAWADWRSQQGWVKRLLDVHTKSSNSRTQSTLALRLWRAQQQLAKRPAPAVVDNSADNSGAEVARLRAANAELRSEMDGILGFMDSDDAKPKTYQEQQASAMTSLSALSAFNSAAGNAASRGIARGLTAEGRAEMAEEKARVVAHLNLMEKQREDRIARGGSASPPPTTQASSGLGSGSPRAAGGWAAMRGTLPPQKKSATGLDLAALRQAAARQEELEAKEGPGAVSPSVRNVVADASSFSNMLDSFVR